VGYGVLVPAAKAAVPLKYELLPQWFKRLGYSTHMVGKWHLGYRSMEHTPTWRGFDTFFGYYNGEMAYYNHTVTDLQGLCGLDLWRNVGHSTKAVTDLRGTYSTQAFTDEAKHIIANHNVEEPLFLYLSYQAVHSTCEDTKPEAPQETVDKYSYITNYNRSVFAGALHVLDHSVGEVLSALQSRDMLADSVVVFTSDNGGGPMDASLSVPNTGNNWPLRGSKGDMWEGGMRVPAVLWYGRLNSCRPRRPSQQLMHIVDWGPTLYAAAGGDVSDLGDVDGRNLWEALTTFKDIGHEDVVLEIEGWKDAAAIISGRYKLVNRSEDPCEPYLNNRVPLPEGDPPGGLDLDALMVSSDAWKAVHEATIHSDPRFWSPPRPNWRQEATIACSASGEPTVNFDPCEDVFVFDIFNDPCELNNLASSQPEASLSRSSEPAGVSAKWSTGSPSCSDRRSPRFASTEAGGRGGGLVDFVSLPNPNATSPAVTNNATLDIDEKTSETVVELGQSTEAVVPESGVQKGGDAIDAALMKSGRHSASGGARSLRRRARGTRSGTAK
ncbi:arylsulfatase B-like, partial [Rhipicephalus sanguineus]|uniref:arylsulfatase B-like n=1 Tax=Rhipicephalus sanguineus TaxID=34632 RepID=UPI0018946F1F